MNLKHGVYRAPYWLRIHCCIPHDHAYHFTPRTQMPSDVCAPSEAVTEHPGKKRSKEMGTCDPLVHSAAGPPAQLPSQLHYPPGCSADRGGGKGSVRSLGHVGFLHHPGGPIMS